MKLRVLDVFSGTRSATQAFADAGDFVEYVELQDGQDVREFHPRRDYYDFVWLSPPCQAFSVAALGAHNFATPDGPPLTETGRMGIQLMLEARRVVQESNCRRWIIENPRGLMRKRPEMSDLARITVWYCRYGNRYAKPTDLWGGFPRLWIPRPACHSGNPDHVSAPSGSKFGIQGGVKNAIERARVPYLLGADLRAAIATEMEHE